MKLVISTQIRENYAAHNEDYVHGRDEPYWKFKGGNTYIVENVSIADAQSESFFNIVDKLIEEKNDAWEEYILHSELVDTCDFDITNFVQEWEAPIMIRFDGMKFLATKTTMNGEFGYMRPEIEKKVESWIMKSKDDAFDTSGFVRTSYVSDLHLKDGRIMKQDEFLNMIREAA